MGIDEDADNNLFNYLNDQIEQQNGFDPSYTSRQDPQDGGDDL